MLNDTCVPPGAQTLLSRSSRTLSVMLMSLVAGDHRNAYTGSSYTPPQSPIAASVEPLTRVVPPVAGPRGFGQRRQSTGCTTDRGVGRGAPLWRSPAGSARGFNASSGSSSPSASSSRSMGDNDSLADRSHVVVGGPPVAIDLEEDAMDGDALDDDQWRAIASAVSQQQPRNVQTQSHVSRRVMLQLFRATMLDARSSALFVESYTLFYLRRKYAATRDSNVCIATTAATSATAATVSDSRGCVLPDPAAAVLLLELVAECDILRAQAGERSPCVDVLISESIGGGCNSIGTAQLRTIPHNAAAHIAYMLTGVRRLIRRLPHGMQRRSVAAAADVVARGMRAAAARGCTAVDVIALTMLGVRLCAAAFHGVFRPLHGAVL